MAVECDGDRFHQAEHIPADMAGFAAAKDGLRQSMLQQRKQTVLASYMDHLKERAHQDGALEIFADKLVRG